MPLTITDLSGNDQRALIWGLRSRHYSSASTARLAYEAEALTRMDAATLATVTGASPGGANNVVEHASLGTDWTPVLNTNAVSGGAYMTHTGTYRVWARVYSTSGDDVQVRFVYDVGDLTNPTENAAWTFPAASLFYVADLGEIRLDETTGTHRWQGQIQAKGAVGGEDIHVDKLYFQPLDEAAGKLTAPISADPGLAAYTARDEFNQTAGNLNAKTAAVGGAWATSGVATDLAVEATGHTAQRSTTGELGFRYAISAAAAMTNQAVKVDFKSSGLVSTGAVIARWTDANNHLVAWCFESDPDIVVRKVVGGVGTTIAEMTPPDLTASTFYTLQLAVTASGNFYVFFNATGGQPVLVLQGFDSALATGGTLASGGAGFADTNSSATADTRNYDNFAAWVPPPDAVIFANQSVNLTTDGMFREDSTGNAYGPVSQVTGDLPRVLASGLEARTVEVFVKGSRGDFDQLPDAGIDDVRGHLTYRPSWLYVPDDTGS